MLKNDMIQRRYKVVGLSSELGARHVRRALQSVPGVRTARVDRDRHEVVVQCDQAVPLRELNDELAGSEEGYLLLPLGHERREPAGTSARWRRFWPAR